MALVKDASVVADWAFKEKHATAESAFARVRTEEAFVPALWWYELRNVLILGERRGRLTEQATARFLRRISRLRISLDRTPDEAAVMTLARRHRLTVYDAAYLELAQREALSLATLDDELARAAQAERNPLVEATQAAAPYPTRGPPPSFGLAATAAPLARTRTQTSN
jgi:predicted nucleic acid-binding protein